MAPDMAGPITKPTPCADASIDKPNAWLLSLQFADIAALALPTTPETRSKSVHDKVRIFF